MNVLLPLSHFLFLRKAKREKENRWQENIRREEEEKKKRLEEERMQEKAQEKLHEEEEKNKQAGILRETEQRQRQLEEEKRKQEQMAKEAEERRKQNGEIKKTKEVTTSHETEKRTAKLNTSEKFGDLLKPTEGKSLKPPWTNEGNLSYIVALVLDFLSHFSFLRCINVTPWQTYCLIL